MKSKNLKRLRKSLSFILRHPFNQDRKLRALWIWFRWQLLSRIRNGRFVHHFVNDAKLYAQSGQIGVTGNIYCGLHEWNDMTFVLHFLRPGDLFVDVGANAGSYTILASGAVKAETIAVEPISSAYSSLLSNIELNAIEDLVKPLNLGVAAESGYLDFTTNLDALNHVVLNSDENSTSVRVDTLDNICTKTPDLIKIDVEGYEYEVLCGASRILADHQLSALIIEWNIRSGKTQRISEMMKRHGFTTMRYFPKTRQFEALDLENAAANVVFARNISHIRSRLLSSEPFRIQNRSI